MDYSAEPTATFFHGSNAFVRGVRGPRGMGKSVMCVWEMILRANAQEPFDGVRRTKWAVIRNAYTDLKPSTIKTYTDWFPEVSAPQAGYVHEISWDHPITSRLMYKLTDGTRVELEVVFLAMDHPKDIKKLLSLEVTGVWINEARELLKAVIDQATASVGRYPPMALGGYTWKGVIMDTNPPDNDHWWYKMFEVVKPHGWEQFVQPPGLIGDTVNDLRPNYGQKAVEGIPAAENIHNLKGGHAYWQDMASGKDWNWIQVYILNRYATIVDGKPVFPEYKDEIHCSKKPLELYRGLPLYLGFDFGLTPACTIMQVSPRGQMRVIDEIATDNIGLRTFVTTYLKPKLANEYAGMSVTAYGDPAGEQRAQTDERTCYDILREYGINAHPASTNDFIPRREGLARYLTMMIDGEPGFTMDPKCIVLRKGLMGNYQFQRKQIVGREEYKDVPLKNIYSHTVESLMYPCMMIGAQVINVLPVQMHKRKIVTNNPARLAYQ